MKKNNRRSLPAPPTNIYDQFLIVGLKEGKILYIQQWKTESRIIILKILLHSTIIYLRDLYCNVLMSLFTFISLLKTCNINNSKTHTTRMNKESIYWSITFEKITIKNDRLYFLHLSFLLLNAPNDNN